MSWIQPSCSCGWVGNKHHAYEDYQHHMVKRQEIKHQLQQRKMDLG